MTISPDAELPPVGKGAPGREPGALSPEGYDPQSEERVTIRGRLRRLMLSLMASNIGVAMMSAGLPSTLLPLQVEDLDPANKASNLALAVTVGAVATILAPPVVGMLSDRTRGRFGRRAPWMVSGALLAALSLFALASANTLAQITVAYVFVSVAISLAQIPLATVLPDRTPRGVRGTFSGLIGLGTMVGAMSGMILGATFAESLPTGYLVFGGIFILGILVLVVLNPDHSNKDAPRPPLDLRGFLRTFWFNPVAHPDFAWAFAGRLLLYLGYHLVGSYQLYILQDHIGLGDDAVDMVPVLGGVLMLMIIISTLVAGPLSDRIRRRKPVVMVAGTLMAVAMVFPWMSPTVGGMVAFSIVGGLGFGAFQSVDTALISEVLPAEGSFGKDMGLVQVAAALPHTIAPALGGVLVAISGYHLIFPAGLIAGLAGTLAVLRIRSVR